MLQLESGFAQAQTEDEEASAGNATSGSISAENRETAILICDRKTTFSNITVGCNKATME